MSRAPALVLALLATPAMAGDFARPDPTMTPGAKDASVTLDRICHECTRHRRPPSTKLCDRVFEAYSIPR